MDYGYVYQNDSLNTGEDMYALAKEGKLIKTRIALTSGEIIKTNLLPVDYRILCDMVKYQSSKAVEYVHYFELRINEGDLITSIVETEYTIAIANIVYVKNR